MDHALDRKTALGIFAGLSIVYWFGRAPHFGPGDSPQHVMSALTWGVSKAPGYPLYTALAHAFSKLAPGSAAAAVNGFSGLIHAYALSLLYLLLRRQGAAMVGALASVGVLAFGKLFWFYSGVAEVRPLNDLLAIAAASAAMTWADNGPKGTLAAFAVLTGLGIGNHPTFVLVLPALGWMALTGRRRPTLKDGAFFAAVALAALAIPYLLLWVRLQVSDPVYNFEQAKTLGDVANLFLRKSTGGPLKMFPGGNALGITAFSFAKLAAHTRWFLSSMAAELGPAGLVLFALGLWAARKCGRRWLAFWGLWLAGTASYFLLVSSQTFPVYDEAYSRATLARFYLLPLIALAAPVSFGLGWLADQVRPAAVWTLCAAVTFAPALLRPMSQRGRDPLRNYMTHVLESSGPKDILLLVGDDSLFAARYLDAVEGVWEDRVILVPAFFSSEKFAAELKRRHPALNIPTTPNGAISDDWRAWKKLNPGRKVLTESVLIATAKRLFPKSQPRAALIELTDTPRPKAEVLAECDRFLKMAQSSGLDRWNVRDFTQEIFVIRVYRQMAVFYSTLLDPHKDIDRLNELETLYRSL